MFFISRHFQNTGGVKSWVGTFPQRRKSENPFLPFPPPIYMPVCVVASPFCHRHPQSTLNIFGVRHCRQIPTKKKSRREEEKNEGVGGGGLLSGSEIGGQRTSERKDVFLKVSSSSSFPLFPRQNNEVERNRRLFLSHSGKKGGEFYYCRSGGRKTERGEKLEWDFNSLSSQRMISFVQG